MENNQFRKAATSSHTVYVPTNEDPLSITILKSGWNNFYHVIIEYGDFEDVKHFLDTSETIKEKWGIEVI